MALIPSVSSSSSSSNIWKYDVFLSFRGVDTRNRFTDHLYTGLKQKGIFTFRDNENLKSGTSIAPELLKAIEESRFAVVILSRDYAFSKWCLIELTKIVECMEKTRLVVLPVFHYVDPSDVRNYRGTFGEAFAIHEKSFKDNIEYVQTWKAALTKVANLAGWDLKDRSEAIVIQKIIRRIYNELQYNIPYVSKDFVGMDFCVKEMLDSYLREGLGGVRFVGICGMGGMGKTTLAYEIYRRISRNFEARSFIANIKEETKNQGLVSLQKQLISNILMESEINIWNVREGSDLIRNMLCNKKVFIVFDDVDEENQLEALVGKHDWFGLGSRIIVTSRDCHLLKSCGVDDIYIAKVLNDDNALQLFSWKAFRKPQPEKDYVNLSKDFVNYAKGLPLALKVLGSSLFDKRMDEWKSALHKLKEEPNRDIMDILQISFNRLTNMQKGLFLDIACFFKGENIDCIRDILESFSYYPNYNIGVLVDKSLITVDDEGTLWMHDLLQEMGQEIVRCESPTEPGGRSRLWNYDDVIHVLKNKSGIELVVEGIKLNIPIQKVEHLNAETFSKMKKLRFLEIGNEKLPDFINDSVQLPKDLIRGKLQLPQGLSYLSNKLRFLKWHGYPLKCIPANLQLNKLVELRMHCSGIKQLWKGKMVLDELKLIDLSESQNLIELSDLSGAPKLKQLIFRHCTGLYKIHASLGDLKQLIKLDLRGCKNLSSLPDSCSCLMSLKILILFGCSKFNELPENLGNIEGLEELDVSETAITRLPSSIAHLKSLREISLHRCAGLSPSSKSFSKLLTFPKMQRGNLDPMGMLGCSLQGLWSLTKLDLSYCNLPAISDFLGCLSSLTTLNLMGNNFVCLPESIIQLSNLEVLYVGGCTQLKMVPKLPLNINHINARGCTSLETLSLRPEHDFQPNLSLVNCVNLVKNQGYGNDLWSTMLRRYIMKRCCNRDSYIYLTIPGSDVPKWFSHQNAGVSVNMEVPSHLLLCNQFMGMAVCAIFIFRQHHSLHQLPIENFGFMIHTHKLRCTVTGNRVHYADMKFLLAEEFGKIESDQLWLQCFPSTDIVSDWKEELNANEFIKIEVTLETFGPGLEVTKCGVHLVFEQDLEDFKQTEAGSSSCIISPYEDELDDSEKDTKIKESGDDEPPHPRWTEHPDLIENWIGNLCIQGQGDSDCE